MKLTFYGGAVADLEFSFHDSMFIMSNFPLHVDIPAYMDVGSRGSHPLLVGGFPPSMRTLQ